MNKTKTSGAKNVKNFLCIDNGDSKIKIQKGTGIKIYPIRNTTEATPTIGAK